MVKDFGSMERGMKEDFPTTKNPVKELRNQIKV